MNKEVGILLKVGAQGLENIQVLGKELAGAGEQTRLLDSRAAELGAELAKLNQQQGLISQFGQQKLAVEAAGQAMTAAKTTATALGRELANTVEPTKAQAREFEAARTASRNADAAYTAQRATLQTLRSQLTAAGISSTELAAAQQRVQKDTQAVADQIGNLQAKYQAVATATRAQAAAAAAGAQATQASTQALKGQGDALDSADGKLASMVAQLRNLTAVDLAAKLGGNVVELVKDVGATAQAFQELQARVKLVTGDGQAFSAAMAGIADVALRTNSNLEGTAKLFTRIAQAGKEMGLSQQQALALTETINKAIQLGGESAEGSNAALTQLIQGLQSGVLRGEEFNSVMEQAPRLARALAEGLGVTVGQLRALAQEGQLSSATVIQALQGQARVLDKEFATLPQTLGRALENLRTQFTLFVGSVSQSMGQGSVLADGINKLANNLDVVAGVAARAGVVLTAALAVEGVAALRALAVQGAATAGVMTLLGTSIEKIPRIVNIAIAVTGFEVGYQIGEMLTENSSLARKLGVGMVQFFEEVVNGLQFAFEAVKAIFTSDTIEAAFQRYEQRAVRMREIFSDMYREAEKSPEVVRAAAAVAAQEAQRMGDAGQRAGALVAAGAGAGASAIGGMGAAAGAAGASVAQAGAVGSAGLQGTAKAAESASSALGTLAATMAQVTPAFVASAQQQAAAMAKVAMSGQQATDLFVKTLPQAIDKLGGAELEAFRQQITRAFGEAEQSSRRLAEQLAAAGESNSKALTAADRAAGLLRQSLVEVGRQAAQSLGVDLDGAGAKVSASFTKAQEELATLVKTLPELKAAGVDTGTVVGEALAKMIDGAKNQAEIDAITGRIQSLGKAGVITGAEVSGALQLATDKAKELKRQTEDATPGIQSLGEAARRAGVDVGLLTSGMEDGFKKGTTAIDDLVKEIVRSGVEASKASPQLAQALDKQIEAAKTKEELDLVRQVIERANASGKLFGADQAQVLDTLATKAKALGDQFAKVFNDQERYQKLLRDSAAYGPGASGGLGGFTHSSSSADSLFDAKSGRYDSEGFAKNTAGQRVVAGGQLQPPDNSGNWEFVNEARPNVAAAAAEYPSLAVQGGYWKRKAGTSASPSSSFSAGSASSGNASTTATDATPSYTTPTPAVSGQGRVITLQFGGRSTTFTVANEAEASGLESLLASLQTAASRSI